MFLVTRIFVTWIVETGTDIGDIFYTDFLSLQHTFAHNGKKIYSEDSRNAEREW
jgi:hypothetical protein